MGRATRGCGCAIAVLLVVAGAGAFVGWKYVLPWWRTQPPPASGGELTIRVLDVGPINGDAILISSPAGKNVLIYAGDTTKGKAVVEALKRNNIGAHSASWAFQPLGNTPIRAGLPARSWALARS